MSFVCLKKSCQKQITAAQPGICCWLCSNLVHVKCAGYSGLVADAVAQRTGLSWTCESCREIETEMRVFMRQTRSGFKDLSVGFNKLNAQFLAVDAQFNSLKLLGESPKRKKSTPRDLQTTAISQFSTVEQFLTPTAPSAPQTMFATPIASMVVDVPIVDAVPTDTAISAPLSDSSAVVKKRTGRPKSNKAPPPVTITAGSPVNLEPTGDSTPAVPPLVSRPLVGIPPMKQIFVSRLAPDSTSEDVMAYIQAKISDATIKVEKFKFSYDRQVASFKINVPPEHFATTSSPSFWPEYLVVKEYKPKIKNRIPIRLPPKDPVQNISVATSSSSSSSSSKN